jgi:hypothetical protein
MNETGAAPRPATAPGRPRRVLVDLLLMLGLGFAGVILGSLLPRGPGQIAMDGVALLGWVAGFALAGLREPSGRPWLGVAKLWAALALVLAAVGVAWFLWLAATIHHPLRLFWRDALGWALIPVGLAAYAAVPALVGWAAASVIRRLKPFPCPS